MRHRIHRRKLNRTSEHRKALRRNMAQSLIEHGQVTTTVAKAKDIRPFFERLVALAVKSRKLAAADDRAGALRARRTIHKLLGDRSIIPAAHQATYDEMSDAARTRTVRMSSGRRHRTGESRGRLVFTAESVTHRLMDSVAARFEDRPGGYTRLIQLSTRRVGDSSRLAMVQLLGDEEAPVSLTKPKKSARRRRTDSRYAFAVKAAKSFGGRGPGKSAARASKPATENETTEADGASPDEPST